MAGEIRECLHTFKAFTYTVTDLDVLTAVKERLDDLIAHCQTSATAIDELVCELKRARFIPSQRK